MPEILVNKSDEHYPKLPDDGFFAWLYADGKVINLNWETQVHSEIFGEESGTGEEGDARNSIFLTAIENKKYIDSLLTTFLHLNIKIPDIQTIQQYLLSYPDIIDVLAFACITASERFSDRAQLSLELFSDYEFDDKYPTLYIRQENYENEIFTDIRKIRSEYNMILSRTSGEFHITTDFAPPRE